MDFPEFDHMTLDDLRDMLKETVLYGPPSNEADKKYLRRLIDAIAEREKTFGKGPATGQKGTP